MYQYSLQASYLIISYFLLNMREKKQQQQQQQDKKLQASVVTVILIHSFEYLCKVHKSRNCVFGFIALIRKLPPDASMDFTILPFRINVDDNTKKKR